MLIGQWGTNVASGAIYPLKFDLMTDFEPVTLIATQPFLIVSRKTLPANNLNELIGWLKSNAAKASQGNSGVGSPSRVAGILFQNSIGANFTLVPYRSAGLSMQGLVAGDVDVMLDTPAVSMSRVRAGNIKAHAVAAKTRIAIAPEVPTTDEAGLPGFYVLACALGTQGHAQGHRRKAQRRGRGRVRRSGHPQAAGQACAGDFSARATYTKLHRD